MYKYIEPEVSGGLGLETDIDNNVHPPIIKKLHYVFDGWLGDDILETFPCFIVSERLMKSIMKNQLKGILFDSVKITKSDEFLDCQPKTILPDFYWMKVNGKLDVDDFVISKDYRLLVSDKALKVIKYFNVNYATLEDYIPEHS